MSRLWALILFGLVIGLFGIAWVVDSWVLIQEAQLAEEVASGISLVVPFVAAGGAFLWRLSWERGVRNLRNLTALKAELTIARDFQSALFLGEGGEKAQARLLDNLNEAVPEGVRKMPTGALVRGNPVFDNLVDEISDLPDQVIEPVIRYYQIANGVADMMIAFYEGRYDKVSERRQKELIISFFQNGSMAAEAASQALKTVSAELERSR